MTNSSSDNMQKELNILVVDLDGTLIKSDMLFETFWSAFSNDYSVPLRSLYLLTKGKAYLKSFLYSKSTINIKSLPYNQKVIDFINSHRGNGGQVALVTGSDQRLAFKIADHLDLFDFVYGSSNSRNLTGSNKANFQKEIFGLKKFDYIGNGIEDISCWEYADKAITINAKKNTKRSCEKVNSNSLHLNNLDQTNLILNFLKEIRTYQWIKNTLVFLPLIAAKKFDYISIGQSSLAFFAFSFVASSVYILNDLIDLKSDRDHAKKCNRPFASGSLSLFHGSIGGCIFLILGFTCAFKISLLFAFVLAIYYTSTVGYSIFLKKKPLFDIFLLTGLYTIRIVGGGVATNLEISFWLLAFSVFIFLSLASIKREAELIELRERGAFEMKGRGYKLNDLNFISIISISSGLIASLVLALYINSPRVLEFYKNPQLLWIACFLFLFWILRISFKTQRGEMEYDPIIFALKDNISKIIFLCIFIFVLVA